MSDAESHRENGEGVSLAPARVAQMLKAGEAQLVDVREPDELDRGRIEGALHVRIEELPARAGEFDREWPVVFHCQGGNRSLMAAEAFRESGYDAYNLAGGLDAWAGSGLPVAPGESA